MHVLEEHVTRGQISHGIMTYPMATRRGLILRRTLQTPTQPLQRCVCNQTMTETLPAVLTTICLSGPTTLDQEQMSPIPPLLHRERQ